MPQWGIEPRSLAFPVSVISLDHKGIVCHHKNIYDIYTNILRKIIFCIRIEFHAEFQAKWGSRPILSIKLSGYHGHNVKTLMSHWSFL